MSLDPHAVLGYTFDPIEQTIDDRDAILYALSIGLADDPVDPYELRYAYEDDLQVFPTMPVVLGYPGNWMSAPSLRITRNMIVHGSQRLSCFEPLPISEPIVCENSVHSLADKGVEKGAIMTLRRRIRMKSTGRLLAEGESAIFCRADGGFGPGFEEPVRPFEPVPTRAPDRSIVGRSSSNAALLYRLNGDRNPIHADPVSAARAGFKRPILHGLCTFGIAATVIDRALARPSSRRISMIETRFSNIVYPGESLSFDLWLDGDTVSFRARAPDRGSIVLDYGRAELT